MIKDQKGKIKYVFCLPVITCTSSIDRTKYGRPTGSLIAILHFTFRLGLVVLRINGSVTLILGSRRLCNPISEIQVMRLIFEPLTPCSASQELNHSTTAAPFSPSCIIRKSENFQMPSDKDILYYKQYLIHSFHRHMH